MVSLDAAEAGNAFAEKLGLWVHFTDAITLSAVHNDGMANLPVIRAEEHVGVGMAIDAEFKRVHTILINSIMKSCTFGPSKAHIKLPESFREIPTELAAAYTPYRRFYETHQRDMEANIQPLRFNVREAVKKGSPKLQKLADLDITLEKILRDRESRLLSKVPLFLKKRFEQLLKEHQQILVDAQHVDTPASWTQAGGWLARFCGDMQMLLLAELELRLQPTVGLIEAFKQDTQ